MAAATRIVREAAAFSRGLALGILVTIPLSAQTISTYAGGGTADGRPATVVALHQTQGMAVDGSGNIYVAEPEQHRVRRIDGSTGVITTAAGVGAQGFSGDGGPATRATLFEPTDVAIDAEGNLFIVDSRNYRIRRVDGTTGVITTVAGNGNFGSAGDGGRATSASLSVPIGVAIDPGVAFYLSEAIGRKIRRVDLHTGTITAYAGDGVAGYAGDGGPATAAKLGRAEFLAVDRTGNVMLADRDNHRVRRVDRSSGIITTIAGTGSNVGSVGDGGPATAAVLNLPGDVDVGPDGALVISESGTGRIRVVAPDTQLIRTAGGGIGYNHDDGIPATTAYLQPRAVGIDDAGHIYVNDVNGAAIATNANARIRRIDAATGIISTVAGVRSTAGVFNGDGGPATSAILNLNGSPAPSWARGVTTDASGNLYIADQFAQRIRRVDSTTGTITTVAGSGAVGAGIGGYPAGVAVDAQGNIYLVDTAYNSIRRVDAATGAITVFASSGLSSNPQGLAIDAAGNLFVTGWWDVRRIDAVTRAISTFAGGSEPGFAGDGGLATAALLQTPVNVFVDTKGNLLIADMANNRIRRVDAVSKIITTVAGSGQFGFSGDGGPATAAAIWGPTAVVSDAAGNLFIADSVNHRIRKVDAATKRISTYAGIGASNFFGSYSGDEGPATRAELAQPDGLAIDASGTLFIADTQSNRIRVISPCIEVAVPQLESPSNGSQGLSTAPVLTWKRAVGARRYDVFVDTVSPPQKVVADNVTPTTFALTNLQPLTLYYWRIVAKGDPYCTPSRSASSETWSFTTSSTCTAPDTEE